MLAAMADLGMAEEQWRQHRANESRDKPRRDDIRRRWLHDLERRERKARMSAGKGTIADWMAERTDTAMEHMRAAFTRQLMFGSV